MNEQEQQMLGYDGSASFAIPRSMTRVWDRSFFDCKTIKEVAIHDDVTIIGSRAFGNCPELESVIIGEGVEYIESYAFRGCCKLKEMKLPKNLKFIGTRAFYGCSALTSIVIPESVSCVNKGAFGNCAGLTRIEVERGNKVCCEIRGMLFNKKRSKLIQCPAGITGAVVLPKTLVDVYPSAFAGCNNLEAIVFDSDVHRIGEWAFKGCALLKDIYVVGMERLHNISQIISETNPQIMNRLNFHYIRNANYLPDRSEI